MKRRTLQIFKEIVHNIEQDNLDDIMFVKGQYNCEIHLFGKKTRIDRHSVTVQLGQMKTIKKALLAKHFEFYVLEYKPADRHHYVYQVRMKTAREMIK